jgi:hypothetical protein
MTTAEPMPWGQLALAAWPLWLSFAVLLTVGLGDQVAACLAWLFRRGR